MSLQIISVYSCHIITQIYRKMSSNYQNITSPPKTIYQIIAKECNVTPRYVGKIARGEKKPKYGKKGLKVKEALNRFNYSSKK